MEIKYLSDFESFNEIPNAILIVKENTSLMYIETEEETFIAREFIDSVENYNLITKYTIGYYDIKDNTKKLTINFLQNRSDDYTNHCLFNTNAKIIPLDKLLNLRKNSVAYLNLDDVNDLISNKTKIK